MSYRGRSLTFSKSKSEFLESVNRICQQVNDAVEVNDVMVDCKVESFLLSVPESNRVEDVDTGWRDVTVKLRYKVSI